MWNDRNGRGEEDDNSAMLTITGQWNVGGSRAPPQRRSIERKGSGSSKDGGAGGGDAAAAPAASRSNPNRFSFTANNRSSSNNGLGLGGGGGVSRFSFGEKNRAGSGLLNLGNTGKGNGRGGLRRSSSSSSLGAPPPAGRFSFGEKNRASSGIILQDGSTFEPPGLGGEGGSSRFTFSDSNRTFSSMLLTITPGNAPRKEEFDLGQVDATSRPPPAKLSWRKRASKLYWDNEVIILVGVSILAAKAYPKLGAVYLAPHITSTWVAVMMIFIVSGMGIRTRDFTAAMFRMKFNLFIQTFSFCALSSIVYGTSKFLVKTGVLMPALGNGLVMVSCLPSTINSVAVLTKQGGGDEAAAIFNSAFANFLGIFVSPVLILGYMGVDADVNMLEVFYKLALRVVLPVLLGQILQRIRFVVRAVKRHKFAFHQSTLYALVWIVYTVFCRTFSNERLTSLAEIFIMVAITLVLYIFLMIVAWYSLKLAFRDKPRLRVMGIFGCSMKTVAMGVPLIEAIYGEDPQIALYTLPLLVWYPIQIVVGSITADKLRVFVKREVERLGLEPVQSDDDEDSFDFLPVEAESQNRDAPKKKTSRKKSSSSSSRRSKKGGSVKVERKGSEGSPEDTVQTFEERENGYDNQSVMDIGDDTIWTYEDDMTIAPEQCVNDHFCLEEGIVYERLRGPSAIACIPGSCCISCYRVIASDVHENGVIPSESDPVFVCMKCRSFAFCSQCWRDNKTDSIVAPSGFVSSFFKSLAEYY